jgi:hypothetical protein
VQYFWLYPVWQIVKFLPEEYRQRVMLVIAVWYTFYM